MKRKALFFDVDGTLLSEITHQVPESAKRALSETRKRGNLVFINSGRGYGSLRDIEEMIEHDGCLCGCGTCVADAEGHILLQYRIPHERGIEIKKAVLRYGFDGILEATEGNYFREELSRIPKVNEFRKNQEAAGSVMDKDWNDNSYDYDKLCVMADEHSDRDGLFHFLESDMVIIDRGDDFYECVPKGYSKATAIEWALKHYGIDFEDAYVFGDSSNDLSMFEYAKHTVLMGRHDAVLEPYATFVTKTVEEDGIEYAMKELGLIR